MKPNVGMNYPVFAPIQSYTPGSSVTYGNGAVISEARGASVSWEVEEGEFYGNDVLLDTANGILGYTIEFEPAGLSDAMRANLLGEVAGSSSASGEYSLTSAAAPMVGFGYVRVMREEGTGGAVNTTYESWWYYRLQFSLQSEETRTKERNIEWRTPTLNGRGTGVQLSSGDTMTFAVHKSHATFAAAKSWLDTKANISTPNT